MNLWPRPRRCKVRLKRGRDPKFHGRCELPRDHYSEMPEEHHQLDRDTVWVRWDKAGSIRYEVK